MKIKINVRRITQENEKRPRTNLFALFPGASRFKAAARKRVKALRRSVGPAGKKIRGWFLPVSRRFRKKPGYLLPVLKITLGLLLGSLIIAGAAGMMRPKHPPASPPDPDRELKSKIGQMLMTGFRGTQAPADSYIARAVKELNLGGVILFDYDVAAKEPGRNIVGPEQVKRLVTELRSFAADSPLLVAVDAEGGNVNRLKPSYGFKDVFSAKIAARRGTGQALVAYWDLAKQLSDLGFNVNFAPVVDLNLDPKNPAIGGIERSYSADPEIVEILAKAFIAAHRSFNIATAVKHFPGHGSSNADSHLGLADVTKTYDDRELEPYERLIKDGAVDSVMTAHIINKEVDPEYPATLSPKFIQEILRQKLGFDGVVFSDDMQMGAICDNYGFEDAIIRAVNAGCDILVFSNNGGEYDESVPYRARDLILKSVKDGRISEARINEAYSRIMEFKQKISPQAD